MGESPLRTSLRQFDADTGQELADPAMKAGIEAMLKQLLIVLVNRLGGNVAVPVKEIDATDGLLLSMMDSARWLRERGYKTMDDGDVNETSARETAPSSPSPKSP